MASYENIALLFANVSYINMISVNIAKQIGYLSPVFIFSWAQQHFFALGIVSVDTQAQFACFHEQLKTQIHRFKIGWQKQMKLVKLQYIFGHL